MAQKLRIDVKINLFGQELDNVILWAAITIECEGSLFSVECNRS